MHRIIKSCRILKQDFEITCDIICRSAVIGLWLRIRKLTVAEIENHRKKRRIITSLIWFFSSLAVAIIVPTIGKAIAIVGALAAHFIFTFPGQLSSFVY